MTMHAVRPDVSDLVLSVFERPLHPELFVHCRSLALRNGAMVFDARLHSAGHVLVLRVGALVVTEVISDRREPLPRHSCLFQHRLHGDHDATAELGSRLRYSVSASIEQLVHATFLRHNEELIGDCFGANLSVCFESKNRFNPGAVSLLRIEATRDSLLVHAFHTFHTFHTFPEHLAVVKTQSLFELI